MGRKARPDLDKYLVSLPIELVKQIDAQAEKENRARSELLAEGAAMYLKRAQTKKPTKK
jgi:metal-responsive CopG/Arc/MetJ family transcriptional regulator